MNKGDHTREGAERTGVSKSSLLLLGGLAALALNADARRRVVGGTRTLLDTAGHTLEDTVKPALATAADQAEKAAQVAVHKGAEALGTLREEVPGRAHALLETVQEVAGQAAGAAASRAGELTREARHAAHDLASEGRQGAAQVIGGASRQATRELAQARRAGQGLLSDAEDRAKALARAGHSTLEAQRRDAERQLARARRDAEKELRAARRSWDAAKLEREVEKRMAPLQKQTARQLALLAKQDSKARRHKAARRPEVEASSGGSGFGGVLTLALLGTGAVVLARVPAARQGILKAVESVSPEAAERLHKASRDARNVIGSMWLERIEEADQTPAPGAARSTQAGTTGATWGGSPEAGSSAASSTTPTPEAQARAAQSQSGQGQSGQGQSGQGQPSQGEAGQTQPSSSKPEASTPGHAPSKPN